jgi:hypothetical protein
VDSHTRYWRLQASLRGAPAASGRSQLRHGLLPKVLAAPGVLAGIAALSFVVLSFLELQTLTLITGAMAVAFHPLWLIWTGIVLGRDGKGSLDCGAG